MSVMWCDNEEQMARTNRSKGAVGPRAVVPRIIRELYEEEKDYLSLLDFGSGKDALHTLAFRDDGWCCLALEQPGNLGPVHALYDDGTQVALNHKFHIVFASNVMNVQPSYTAIASVLESMSDMLMRGGCAIFNMPNEPRKCACNRKAFEQIILNVFHEFEDITPKGYSGRVYRAWRDNK